MSTHYIVTQLQSPRHIVTRGFGAFVPLVDLGQAEIIELGNALVSTIVDTSAGVKLEKELTAYITDDVDDRAYITQTKLLIARVFTEPAVLVER